MRTTSILWLASLLLLVTSGCRARLRNYSANDFKEPRGVPWVETRLYDVYVVQGQGDDTREGRLLYYGRHGLTDRVNDLKLKHRRWETNYRAYPFSDASIEISFHGNGNLKKVGVKAKTEAADALKSAGAAVSLQDDIAKKELERLQRERALRDARKALEKGEDEP